MDITLIFEWIAFAFSLTVFNRRNDKRIRLLIAIMTITVIVEAIGYYYHYILSKANHQFYNVSVPLIILLFLWMFLNHYAQRSNRRFVLISIFVYALFCLINIFFIQGEQRFSTYNYILGALLLVTTTVLYFLELIRLPVPVSLKKEPMFWIATAVLLLYLPKSVLYAVFEYLAYRNEVNESFGHTFHLINRSLSVIFFSILSYASICRLLTSPNSIQH